METTSPRSYRTPFILLSLLFFLLGFITVLVDSLIPRLRELFTLSYFEAGLVQFAFFGAYFLLSIPSSYVLNKVGYKMGIIIGLATMGIGCLLFYPAADFRLFSIFIVGYFTLAAGMAILQVAINPYIAVLGDESTASRRLTLSQAFNSLGTAIAPAFGAWLVLSDRIKTSDEIALLSADVRTNYLVKEAEAVQSPFIGLALFILLIAILFVFIKLPVIIQKSTSKTYWQALKVKNLRLGVIGIFCYVGAEVAIGSYLVNYFLSMNLNELIQTVPWTHSIASFFLNESFAKLDGKAIVGVFVTFYWLGAMVGRFLGFLLMQHFKPSKIVQLFGIVAIILLLISMLSSGLVSMWSILAVGLFNSIMFPTIFTLAIDGLGELKPKGSGLLCTAIVGGAIIPPIFGYFIDLSGFKLALIFIMLCYAYISYYGWYCRCSKILSPSRS